jgi:hypothetical protein
MAGRSSTTFKKRQKEIARQEKQREKAARRAQRKVEKKDRPDGPVDELAGVDFEFNRFEE